MQGSATVLWGSIAAYLEDLREQFVPHDFDQLYAKLWEQCQAGDIQKTLNQNKRLTSVIYVKQAFERHQKAIMWRHILAVLALLETQLDENTFGRIYDRLWRNNKNGRVIKVAGWSPQPDPTAYINAVIGYDQKHHAMFEQLEHERSIAAWIALHQKVSAIVRNFLFKAGVQHDLHEHLVENYAQDVIEILLKNSYTYDTSFIAWVTVTTKNICRNHARTAKSKTELLNREAISLDIAAEQIDRNQEGVETLVFNAQQIARLPAAVAQLPPTLRLVIMALFIDNHKPAHIAQTEGISTSVISRRKHEALQQLRKLLGE